MRGVIDITDQDFEYFRGQVLNRTGIHLASTKKDLVRSRLLPLLDKHGFKTLQDYRNFLVQLPVHHEEWQDFINQITTNKTEFFREQGHFKILIEKFLPAWLEKNPSKTSRLRVWSAACSTGEEPYTLAMVLLRFFKESSRFEILASDIDTTVLAHAANGVYSSRRLVEIPNDYQTQSIAKGKGEVADWFKIRNEVKRAIQFQRINLVDGHFERYGSFDLIFCRNVFIYFQPDVIDQICQNFDKVLKPEGILVLGHSESLGPQAQSWRTNGQSVYSKLQGSKLKVAQAKEAKPVIQRELTRKKVLIVDDSSTMRQLLSSCMAKSSQLNVVGQVGDPRELAKAIALHKPDVITLDLKMPHMSGCEVLEKILHDSNIPALIISAVTMEEGPEVLRALELGAVDYMEKPTFESLKSGDAGLVERVIAAASTKVRRGQHRSLPVRRQVTQLKPGIYKYQKPLLLMGASTGGVQALTEILTQLPESIPPILIVQHIPAVFSKAFATRLDQICPFHVKEAEDGDPVLQDQVLIAPGGKHMLVEMDGPRGLKVRLSETPPVNRHRPSVDVLFESAAQAGLAPHIVGVILTGMGNDGAKGLKLLKDNGAQTIAQDEASSAVFGMPREAIRLQAADTVCSLEKIPRTIERLLLAKSAKSA